MNTGPAALKMKHSCIKNETRVREAEEFFLIEVPDNVRKIVIVKAQVHGVMTYITPPLFFSFFFHTLLKIIENSIVLHYFNTYFNTRPIKQMFTEVNFIFLNVKLNVKILMVKKGRSELQQLH
jgi:hypothetical protein